MEKKKVNHVAELEKQKNAERISEINAELGKKINSNQMKTLDKMIDIKGEKLLSYWRNIRNFSFILSSLFLIFLYFIFRYLTTNFKIIEDSFTNIFCPI